MASKSPPGSGWEPIPGGKSGGMRRRRTAPSADHGAYEYWYPAKPPPPNGSYVKPSKRNAARLRASEERWANDPYVKRQRAKLERALKKLAAERKKKVWDETEDGSQPWPTKMRTAKDIAREAAAEREKDGPVTKLVKSLGFSL